MPTPQKTTLPTIFYQTRMIHDFGGFVQRSSVSRLRHALKLDACLRRETLAIIPEDETYQTAPPGLLVTQVFKPLFKARGFETKIAGNDAQIGRAPNS